jgi:hypothetical protein
MRRDRKVWNAVERRIGIAAGAELNADARKDASEYSGSRRR